MSTQSYFQGPPEVPYPWVADWDRQSDSWIFVNQDSGHRTSEYPSQPSNTGQSNGASYDLDQCSSDSHTGRNAALGAMAGLTGGALLTHEDEKIESNWYRDKTDFETDIANLPNEAATWTGEKIQEVEDIPDEIANWAGRKISDVEDIPQDIENGSGNAVQDVEDVPGDVTGWPGRKVGEVEEFGEDVQRYGDRVDDAYDVGREQGRHDGDDNY